jgi:hypothetical protein
MSAYLLPAEINAMITTQRSMVESDAVLKMLTGATAFVFRFTKNPDGSVGHYRLRSRILLAHGPRHTDKGHLLATLTMAAHVTLDPLDSEGVYIPMATLEYHIVTYRETTMEGKMVVGLVSEADIAQFEVMLHDPQPEVKPRLYLVK